VWLRRKKPGEIKTEKKEKKVRVAEKKKIK
jgi:hypothetical protein